MPIIIDTDPGVDDALAIMLAVKSGLNVSAFISVYGNADLKNTTENLLLILDWMGAADQVRLGRGVGVPLVGKARLAEVHGVGGLGGLKLEKDIGEFDVQDGMELYKRLLNEDKQTIVALGPLTNLAKFFGENPETLDRVEKIIIMGGVIGERGNVSEYAEFNCFNDPEAFEKVLELPVEKVLIPANICRRLYLTKEELEGMKDLPENFKQVIDAFINYYMNNSEHGGFEGGVMYDVLTILYLLKPALFTLEDARVEVNTSNGERRAETVRTEGDANCNLMVDLEVEELKKFWLSV